MGNTEGKRPLGKPRCRWEDKIQLDLQEVEWEAWTELAQNLGRWWEFVNPAMKFRVPQNV